MAPTSPKQAHGEAVSDDTHDSNVPFNEKNKVKEIAIKSSENQGETAARNVADSAKEHAGTNMEKHSVASSPESSIKDSPDGGIKVNEGISTANGSESTSIEEKRSSIPDEKVIVPKQESTENKQEQESNKDEEQSDTCSDERKPPPQDVPSARPQNESFEQQQQDENSKTPDAFRSSPPVEPIEIQDESLKRLKKNIDNHLTNEALDEDAIGLKMIATDRIVTDRTRQLFLQSVDCEDSEEEMEQQRAYQQEMDHVLLLDNFKHSVQGVDKKTTNWLRKALGMKRSRAHHHHHSASSATLHPHSPDQKGGGDESDEDPTSPTAAAAATLSRRLTRGMVRTTRIRKREERVVRENQGLEALFSAVVELEGTEGPFPMLRDGNTESDQEVPAPKRPRLTTGSAKQRKQANLVSPKGTKGTNKRKQPSPTSAERKAKKNDAGGLLAVIPAKKSKSRKRGNNNETKKTVRVVKIVVNGRRVKSPTPGGNSDVSPKQEKLKTTRKALLSKKKKAPKSKLILEESPPTTPEERNRKTPKKRKKTAFIDMEDSRDEAEEERIKNGQLFGEMHKPHHHPALNDKVMSLSLLDWRRRQQWTPPTASSGTSPTQPSAKKSKSPASPLSRQQHDDGKSIGLPARIVEAGIDAGLPSWETVNPIPRVPREPTAALEPSRRRHTNATYASWCSKLINCINGSGRMMAHYEFFYSDIDRAWFNMDEFQVEMATLGITPTMKLTRSEWSVVRRQIRKRPRRFSSQFIISQIRRLEVYRYTVRRIQNNPDGEDSLAQNFGYDVPAPIRVGATVTAFNKKAHLLHRGIVLAHDVKNNGYLVQFERKELGYEFCPDTDVASHGVPEILVHAPTISLDGSSIASFSSHHAVPGALAYGTSYGQLAEFRRNEKKQAIQRLMLCSKNVQYHDVFAPETTLNDPSSTPSSGDMKPNDLLLPVRPMVSEKEKRSEKDKLIEKVAEREMLVKLIGLIDTALLRKQMLIDAMEKCHALLEAYTKMFGDAQSLDIQSLKHHYSWLHANLGLTNQSLEPALMHLQIMYSNAYAGKPYSVVKYDEEQERLCMERKIREASDGPKNTDEEWHTSWVNTMSQESTCTAPELVSSISGKAALMNESRQDARDAERHKFLESRLASASQFLLTMNYGCESCPTGGDSYTGKTKKVLSASVVGEALSATMNGLCPRPLAKDATKNELLQKMDEARHSAFQELEEALSLFQSELTAQRACETLEVGC